MANDNVTPIDADVRRVLDELGRDPLVLAAEIVRLRRASRPAVQAPPVTITPPPPPPGAPPPATADGT